MGFDKDACKVDPFKMYLSFDLCYSLAYPFHKARGGVGQDSQPG